MTIPTSRHGISLRRALLLILGLLALAGRVAAHPLAPSLLDVRETGRGKASVLWRRPLLLPVGVHLEPLLPAGCRDRPAASLVPDHSGSGRRLGVRLQDIRAVPRGSAFRQYRILRPEPGLSGARQARPVAQAPATQVERFSAKWVVLRSYGDSTAVVLERAQCVRND